MKEVNKSIENPKSYVYYKHIFEGQQMPFAFVDLDLFDENVTQSIHRAKDKFIRIASKSIRCRTLMQRVLNTNPKFQGIMCYAALEAVWLSKHGFDNLLVAYPTFHEKEIEAVVAQVKQGKRIFLMVDSEKHLAQIDKVAKRLNTIQPVCMDLDMSSQYPGIYFGVFRSSLKNIKDVRQFAECIQKYPNVALEGLMGYEAQIAGVGDAVPHRNLMNHIIRFLKKKSIKEIAARRNEVVQFLQKKGFNIQVVNGGGTGSLESTTLENVVTEVTVGSGFYASNLFDFYKNFKYQPAAAYAIEIVRKPTNNRFTCLGGGYVASGANGKDKVPTPYLPKGCKLVKEEMAGEVQTPIIYSGSKPLTLGNPIFMRHSKAGELCEHFNELFLISNGKIVDKVPTYRGEGMAFL